jgi:hypothetical protein
VGESRRLGDDEPTVDELVAMAVVADVVQVLGGQQWSGWGRGAHAALRV